MDIQGALDAARNVDGPSVPGGGGCERDDASSVPTCHDSLSESTFPLDSVFEDLYDKVSQEIERSFQPIQKLVYPVYFWLISFWLKGHCADFLQPVYGQNILGAGGPRQYLHSKFPVRADRSKQLAAILFKHVGEASDVHYVTTYPVSVCLSGHLFA